MGNSNNDNIENDIFEIDFVLNGSDIKRFMEFMNATNKFSGIVFKKAELENNFNKVYSQAIKKLVEFQFYDFKEEIDHENFLEIFGEAGG